MRGKNLFLRAEERAEDLHAAFDTALDKMDRQVERYKGKHYRGRGDGRSAAEAAEEILDDETGELTPLVARRKKFILIPMNEDEAIVQMRELGHESFFVFYNARDEQNQYSLPPPQWKLRPDRARDRLTWNNWPGRCLGQFL